MIQSTIHISIISLWIANEHPDPLLLHGGWNGRHESQVALDTLTPWQTESKIEFLSVSLADFV